MKMYEMYLEEIQKYPLLSSTEEKAVAEKISSGHGTPVNKQIRWVQWASFPLTQKQQVLL